MNKLTSAFSAEKRRTTNLLKNKTKQKTVHAGAPSPSHTHPRAPRRLNLVLLRLSDLGVTSLGSDLCYYYSSRAFRVVCDGEGEEELKDRVYPRLLLASRLLNYHWHHRPRTDSALKVRYWPDILGFYASFDCLETHVYDFVGYADIFISRQEHVSGGTAWRLGLENAAALASTL